MKILVMRPSPAGEELVDNLNNIGIFAHHFSLFNFVFHDDEKGLSKNINLLYQSDIIIIFSKKAIHYTNLYLQENYLKWPFHTQYYAIGKSTAVSLYKHIKKKLIFLKKKKIANLYCKYYLKKM